MYLHHPSAFTSRPLLTVSKPKTVDGIEIIMITKKEKKNKMVQTCNWILMRSSHIRFVCFLAFSFFLRAFLTFFL